MHIFDKAPTIVTLSRTGLGINLSAFASTAVGQNITIFVCSAFTFLQYFFFKGYFKTESWRFYFHFFFLRLPAGVSVLCSCTFLTCSYWSFQPAQCLLLVVSRSSSLLSLRSLSQSKQGRRPSWVLICQSSPSQAKPDEEELDLSNFCMLPCCVSWNDLNI